MINFENVSKARSLFKERGAIRREYIRDEIAYSWVRSRLYSKKNVVFKEEKIRIFIENHEYSPDEIISFISEKVHDFKGEYDLFIIGSDGKIKNKVNNNTNSGIKIPISFREEHIGTNGIGIAFSLKKSVIVYGSEHYNEEFDELISASILNIPFKIENGVLGLIAKKSQFDIKLIDEIIDIKYDLINKKDSESDFLREDKVEKSDAKKLKTGICGNDISQEKFENISEYIDDPNNRNLKIPYCLIGKSDEKVKLRAMIQTKAINSSLINIYGKKGSGREYLARYIHESSKRYKEKFIRINPKIDIDYVMDREIDRFQNGTFYIENYNELNCKLKAKIQRKINCKLVNSSSDNACYLKSVAFIFSNDLLDCNRRENEEFLTSLKLTITDIASCEDDLQDLISKIIEERLRLEKGIENFEIFGPMYIRDRSKDVLTEVLKLQDLSYRSLDNNLNKILKITSKSIEVNQLKDALDIKRSSVANTSINIENDKDIKLFKKLKELELDYIKEVMKYTDNNIARASEILGIGRTTIYRKLKDS